MTRRLFIATVFCLGCLGDSVINVATSTGSYALKSVNGSPLPYTIAGANGSQTVILDDVIALLEGNVFNETGHSRVTVSGQQPTDQTITASGSYSLLSTSATLHNDATGTLRTAQINGNAMTIADAGLTWVFTK